MAYSVLVLNIFFVRLHDIEPRRVLDMPTDNAGMGSMPPKYLTLNSENHSSSSFTLIRIYHKPCLRTAKTSATA